MQIHGVREFTSRLIHFFQNTERKDNALTLSTVLPQQNIDILNFSDIGKGLRFHSKSEGVSTMGGSLQTGASDPVIDLMDSSLSKMEGILEKMHELATKAAKDEELSLVDRMNMQIEMEDLRIELARASTSMNNEFAKTAGYKGDFEGFSDFGGNGYWGSVNAWPRAHDLERARDRIMNGEEWDVAEGLRVFMQVKEVRHGGQIIRPNEDGMVVVDLPENTPFLTSAAPIGNEYYVLSDDERNINGGMVPTVGEKLRASDTIILLDSKSAAEGVKRLELEREKLQAVRNEFDALKAEASGIGAGMSTLDLQALMQEYMQVQDVHTSANGSEEKEEKTSSKLTFVTKLGIMETNEMQQLPKLVRPINKEGVMFAKLGKIFESIAANLAKPRENDIPAISVVNINLDRRFSEVA